MLTRTVRLMIIAVVFLPATAVAQQEPGSYFHQHMWDGGWHAWFLGPIMMIVFVAVLVGAVVLLVRSFSRPGHGLSALPHSEKTPLDILSERFARGEIDKKEFEERRRILGD